MISCERLEIQASSRTSYFHRVYRPTFVIGRNSMVFREFVTDVESAVNIYGKKYCSV